MAKSLVTYHANEMPHDLESMTRAREAFMQWAEKTGPALSEPGAPVAATKVVSASGVSEGPASSPLNGWSVIDAPDAATAAAILADHPFIERGGQLQINEPVEF